MAELGKKLGKLSIAILENFVEGALGKKFVDELRAPTDRVLAVATALEQTETLFRETFEDKDVSRALFVDLKQSDRPVLREAVGKFFDHPTDPSLRQALQNILFDEFQRVLSTERIERAVDFYIRLLTKELMLADADFCDKIAALAGYEENLAAQRSAQLLEQVVAWIMPQQIGAQQGSASSAQSNIDIGSLNVGGNVGGSIIAGHDNVINITPEQQVFRSLYQLPEPPADFTGREELTKLLVADFEKGKGATITGLTGMGGIGKTALGLVVAHQVAENYPDAQIFLDLRGTASPLSAVDVMRHVVLSFEPTMDLRTIDEAGMVSGYRSVLHGKRALLFLDNARSAEQIAPLRPSETCAMLVTSRWMFHVPGLHPHRLDVMKEEDAKAFLLELCPRVGDKADELAKACGCLPLALRIAGSFLEVNSNWRVEDYLKQLSDRKHRLARLHESYDEAGLATEPDLLATFELSYQQLPEENQKRWRMLGVFPTSFDASAAQAMWELEENETRKLLGVLLRYSLLDYDETFDRYSLHDLLADYALSKMDAEEQYGARLKHSAHYKNVLGLANHTYLKGNEDVKMGLRLLDLEWENIRAGQAWAAEARKYASSIAKLCLEYPNAGVYILSLRQHARERIQWWEAALSASRQISDRGSEGASLGSLGNAYRVLGETRKAIDFYERALVILHQIGNRGGESAALSNLGIAYQDLGQVRKAIELYEQALVIVRKIRDRRSEGNAIGNLGSAYRALGDVHKATKFYEQALVIDREIGDRRGEGDDLSNLGSAYAILGQVGKAIELYEQALNIHRGLGDRRGEGRALINLGSAYRALGNLHKALEFYEPALIIVRESGDRRSEVIALSNLGIVYRNLGDVPKTIDFYNQGLVITREMNDRRSEGLTLINLGNAYAYFDDAHNAIKLYEQALIIAREIGDRGGEGTALGNIGLANVNLGDAHKALVFYEQALVIHREIGDRRGEGSALGNLGNAYAIFGDVREATKFYEQALAIFREIGDRSSEATTLFNEGVDLYELREADQAIYLMKRALEIFEEIESPRAEEAQKKLREWGALL